ncbi:MAG: hypothetical protein RIF32_05085 [Leptospirales bacterium]
MFRRATATFLLTYLTYAAFGSVFANEHIHQTAAGTQVHRHDRQVHDHSHDRGHSHHHHSRASNHTDRDEGSERVASSANPSDFVLPPHRAASLLAHIVRAALSFRGIFAEDDANSAVAETANRQGLDFPLAARSYSNRVRESTAAPPPTYLLLKHLPRPPPAR